MKISVDRHYFNVRRRKVLQLTDGIHKPGEVRFELAMCLLLSWIVVYFCVWKGIKSAGKVQVPLLSSPLLSSPLLSSPLLSSPLLSYPISLLLFFISSRSSILQPSFRMSYCSFSSFVELPSKGLAKEFCFISNPTSAF